MTVLFWVLFVGNLRNVMDLQRIVGSRLWPSSNERPNLHVSLHLLSPDPSVAEFLLVVPRERAGYEVERVQSSGVVELSWSNEPGVPLTWRAVALDRAGCIVYAGTAMWSPRSISQSPKLELLLRHLDLPLCTPAPATEKPIAFKERK